MRPPAEITSANYSRSGFRRLRLKCKRMQSAAHVSAQSLIDQLMLLNSCFALEGGRDHRCGVVIAIAREILDRYFGVRQSLLD